jgi:CheY-like chemotaxis protein
MEWVTDGHEALDYVYRRNEHTEASTPDVILLDLGLPRISGYDVLKNLKTDPAHATIPVVVLTTSRNPFDRSQCQALGADIFLSKPRSLKGYEALVVQLMSMELPKLKQAAARALKS